MSRVSCLFCGVLHSLKDSIVLFLDNNLAVVVKWVDDAGAILKDKSFMCFIGSYLLLPGLSMSVSLHTLKSSPLSGRLEAELEKLQNSGRSADTTLFSTPCWNTTSPWEHNGTVL